MRFAFPLIVVLSAILASSAYADETNHFTVFSEYVRELGTIEAVRSKSQNEYKGIKDNNGTMANCIRFSTRMNLELTANIVTLKGMKLNEPFDFVLPSITSIYLREIALYKEMSQICSTMIAGPQAGVNYGTLSARMPQINATLEYLAKTQFNGVTPAIFALLVDPHPDKNNHVSHLLITKAQRKELIEMINNEFGKKLTAKNQNYTVAAAAVLKYDLNKKFKSSDDPW